MMMNINLPNNKSINEDDAAHLLPALDEDLCMSFPQRLMELLNGELYSDTITWLPHGKGFIIHKKKKFATDVLPRYFKQAKFTSFTRKLNRWGFTRVTQRGPEFGAYYHKFFQRDAPRLCMQMTCESGCKNKVQEQPHTKHIEPEPLPTDPSVPSDPQKFIEEQEEEDGSQQSSSHTEMLRHQLRLRLEQERSVTNRLFLQILQQKQQELEQAMFMSGQEQHPVVEEAAVTPQAPSDFDFEPVQTEPIQPVQQVAHPPAHSDQQQEGPQPQTVLEMCDRLQQQIRALQDAQSSEPYSMESTMMDGGRRFPNAA